MDELREKVVSTNKKTREMEVGKTAKEIDKLKDEEQLYKDRRIFEAEYADRIDKSREVRNLWFYCGSAFALIMFGMALFHKKYDWIGLSLIISGYVEIIYWSSPSIFFGGANVEHTALLVNKIAITTIAIAMVITSFRFYNKMLSNQSIKASAL